MTMFWCRPLIAALAGLPLALCLTQIAPAEPPATTAPAAEAAPAPAKPFTDGWIRLRKSKGDPRELRLQVATREYVPDDGKPGPRIDLVSAVHIADKTFYDDLQKKLDASDLVLFEGVGPPGLGQEKLRRASAKAERTKHRLLIVGEFLASVRRKEGRYPGTLDELAQKLAPSRTKIDWLATARLDAWNHEVVYRPTADGADYQLSSLGADGEEGGVGKNADIPIDKADLGKWKEEGIQSKLASAFGLTFQSNGISTDGSNWRNSDLGMDEVARRLGGDPNAPGADEDDAPAANPTILDMLNPDSTMARVGSMVLGIIKMIPGGADRGKLMMMLILPNAEDALGSMRGGGPLGEMFDMQRTMKVIIEERNQKVVDDLKGVIESWRAAEAPGGNNTQPAQRRTIAVFYGGGHMPDLESRLADQLGYHRAAEKWSNAIRLDLDKAGIEEDEVRSLARMMNEQMETLKRMSK